MARSYNGPALIPERISRLSKDKRGYPIPWNVLRAEDGTPFFTVNDDVKTWTAIRRDLCPICGERLGRWRWFVGGILSAFDENGWYLDLPGHRECIAYALATCPYLAAPKYLGRIDVVNPVKLPPEAQILLDETLITERPEIFVAAPCDVVEVTDRFPLTPYMRPARPWLVKDECSYWRHGQQISREDAQPYIEAALAKERPEDTLP